MWVSDLSPIRKTESQGDFKSAEELLPLVYEELRKLAAVRIAQESHEHTLQPTALVHEAWLALTGGQNVQWQNRGHFFAAAAEAMRRILINNARRRNAIRHGGGQQRLNVDDLQLASSKDEEMLAIDDALEKLARHDPVKADLVKLKYFVGFSNQETADILGISEPTVKRYWTYAKAWLLSEIKGSRQP
jgi:RNA polymerase sigma factor (TIGR02999 family)